MNNEYIFNLQKQAFQEGFEQGRNLRIGIRDKKGDIHTLCIIKEDDCGANIVDISYFLEKAKQEERERIIQIINQKSFVESNYFIEINITDDLIKEIKTNQ